MTREKLERLLPRIFSRVGVVVLAGRIGEGVAYARVNVNLVILAQSLERLLERLDRLDLDASIVSCEQPEDRHVDRAQLRLVIRNLSVVDDACIQRLGKQFRRVQRPAAAETPTE